MALRRAAAGVSTAAGTATQVITSLARAAAPESHGVQLLALTRAAASLACSACRCAHTVARKWARN